MTQEMHAQFQALCALVSSEDMSEEEWALVQVHMAYCDDCNQAFLRREHASTEGYELEPPSLP